jgi:hypothetical protein
MLSAMQAMSAEVDEVRIVLDVRVCRGLHRRAR